MNPKKNKELRSIWLEKGEYKKLKDALDQGMNDEVLDIMYKINLRGDI